MDFHGALTTARATVKMRLYTRAIIRAYLSFAVDREAAANLKAKLHKTPNGHSSLAGWRRNPVHAQILHHLPVVIGRMSQRGGRKPDAGLRTLPKGTLDLFERVLFVNRGRRFVKIHERILQVLDDLRLRPCRIRPSLVRRIRGRLLSQDARSA